MDRIDMAQNRDRWRALVNEVMNLRVQKMRGVFRLAEDLLASYEGFCSIELFSQSVSQSISQSISQSVIYLNSPTFFNTTLLFCPLLFWAFFLSLYAFIFFLPLVFSSFHVVSSSLISLSFLFVLRNKPHCNYTAYFNLSNVRRCCTPLLTGTDNHKTHAMLLTEFFKLISETCVLPGWCSRPSLRVRAALVYDAVYCSVSGSTYRTEQLCVCFNLSCSLMNTNSVTTTEVQGSQDQIYYQASNLKFLQLIRKGKARASIRLARDNFSSTKTSKDL